MLDAKYKEEVLLELNLPPSDVMKPIPVEIDLKGKDIILDCRCGSARRSMEKRQAFVREVKSLLCT